MKAVRHSQARTSCPSGKAGLRSAMAFMFVSEETAVGSHGRPTQGAMLTKGKDDVLEKENLEHRHPAGVQLPPFELYNLGLLLPAAWAAHSGLLLAGGAACACMPMMAPFQIPNVSPDSWIANKRARAFHRCCVLGVYTQGAFALFKFAGGDLVGGTYMGLQAAMGAYAISPDGSRMMPSYMMMSGFNGVLGLVQTFQQFQGVPLHYIPFMAILPPTISILSCYWGWQFCQELRAIGSGMHGEGPQDTCWVKFMGGDIWPITLLSPTIEPTERERAERAELSAMGGRSAFSAFGGNGMRLGGDA